MTGHYKRSVFFSTLAKISVYIMRCMTSYNNYFGGYYYGKRRND
nr:MAG TPA: hypothetical protein [Caudoviricetes sp.]